MKPYLTVLIFFALLVACVQASPQNATPKVDRATTSSNKSNPDIPVITLVKSGGLAGKTESITIYSNGKLLRADGSEQSLNADQVSNLLNEIQAIGFFQMKNIYGVLSNCKDCFTYEITIHDGDNTKTIKAIEGAQGVPAEIWQIVDKIQGLASEKQ
jgi:PBP1b-binding outer membrane lipoprotein LpoB